jgi:hypothetical protein
MPNKALSLGLDTLAVRLERFSNYRRSDVGAGGVQYSLIGTPVADGPAYEFPQLWEISASVTVDQYDQLRAMFDLQHIRRRTQVDFGITIEDTMLHYRQSGTVATRKIVPTFTTTSIAGVALKYYATFKGEILTLTPTVIGNASRMLVDLTIAELDRVPPP